MTLFLLSLFLPPSPPTDFPRHRVLTANPLLHSWDVLQPKAGHIQTVTVVKQKEAMDYNTMESLWEGLRYPISQPGVLLIPVVT